MHVRELFDLSGRVAIVTGGGRGIGRHLAIGLAEAGADLVLASRKLENCQAIADEVETLGRRATAVQADLSEPNNISTLFDMCQAELGPVDILVNNHTHCVCETFDPALTTREGIGVCLITSAGIDAHFAVNARAYALMMSEYLNRYLKRSAKWGRIINISTDAAHAHTANVSYAASKHAIESYSRSAAAEMGKYGITVNIVAPGPIQTGYLTPEQEADIAANTPRQRIGHPEDVADVIVFLASEQARWLTGQLLYVGGGWRMHQ